MMEKLMILISQEEDIKKLKLIILTETFYYAKKNNLKPIFQFIKVIPKKNFF
jgi:hypothetical protein